MVIDTNVIVQSIARRNPYNIIFTSFVAGKFFLYVSNSIMEEYEETVERVSHRANSQKLLDLLAISPFVIPIDPRFGFNLISADPDDNKFDVEKMTPLEALQKLAELKRQTG